MAIADRAEDAMPRGRSPRSAKAFQAWRDLEPYSERVVSSRSNHDLAKLQLDSTVRGESCSTAEVSSTLNPPKNRNSTTRLLRASRAAMERFVQRDEIRRALAREQRPAVQGNVQSVSASLRVFVGTRIIHQDSPHQIGRHRKEMRPILPVHPASIDQPVYKP